MDALTDLLTLVATNAWLYGGSFLLVLSVLVVVHEWGHYAAARACGVKVEEFSVGFGREIYGWNDRAGTRWKISLLPIGGYVKMFGDADPAGAGKTDQVKDGEQKRPMTEAERAQAFFSKSILQRAFIVFAGPAINFIFAIVVLAAVFVTQGKEIIPPVATGVQVSGGGYKAGIMPGDRIISIDGKPIEGFDDLRRAVMLALDTPMQLQVDRGGEVKSIIATPERKEMEDNFGFKHERGMLGVFGPNNGFALKEITAVDEVPTGGDIAKTRTMLAEKMGKGPFTLSLTGQGDVNDTRVVVNPSLAQNPDLATADALVPAQQDVKEYKKYTLFSGLVAATVETYDITRDSLYALGQMITGVRSSSELGGVIRIGSLAGDMASIGFVALITFTALLSINLGMVNLFPIPMLDGGHLMFYALEALRGGRPVPEWAQEYAFRFGLVVLVFLMAYSNLNDIMQLIF